MAKTVLVDGVKMGMMFPVIAQDEVLQLLGVETYQDLAEKLQGSSSILNPVMLGKVAFIGCKYHAMKNKQPFDYDEETFLLSITSPLSALEQLLDDFGMNIPAGVLPKNEAEVGRGAAKKR